MRSEKRPNVSVIMPARNAAAYIDAAAGSVLNQSMTELELLVIDDGSTDGTAARVRAIGEDDNRIRLLTGPGRGPATARNLGILRATGQWVALMDADDVMDTDRLENLVRAAERDGVDLIADNLMAFYEDGQNEHPWLEGALWLEPGWIDLNTLLRLRPGEELGYLKPLLRRAWLLEHDLLYDESLRIGEDFDLVLRALLQGARYRYVPTPAYRYRRHAGSISHRLDATQVAAMMSAMEKILPALSDEPRSLATQRLQAMGQDRAFAILISDLKAGRYGPASRALRSGGLRARLLRAISEGMARRLRGSRSG